MGGQSKGIMVIDQSKCNGCGDCYDTCHAMAIHIVQGQYVINIEQCLQCGSCVLGCTRDCIEVRDK